MKIKDIILQMENISFDQALEYLVKKATPKGGQAQKSEKKTFVVTINPELVMIATENSEYEKILKSADLAVADGIGIIWAGKMFGKSFPERIHGVDLVKKLSEAVSDKPITVGLVGGRENVAQLTAECLRKKHPSLKISYAVSEWEDIKGSQKTDILFVAFGSPKQELWIYDNLDQIDTKVVIGVGGAFDFISGKVKRAPIWIRKIGLEWLFRLIIQPWRIKRQLALPRFAFLVFKERFL